MNDIKTEFKQWLIKKGYKEKTLSGKPSTIYNYLRYIDILCKNIYSCATNKEWLEIARNIYPILSFHILCKEKNFYITKDNAKELWYFLSKCYGAKNIFESSNRQKYFKIELYHNNSQTGYPLLILETFINSLQQEDTILLTIDVEKDQNHKIKNALVKYYDFLAEIEHNPFSEYLYINKHQNKNENSKVKQLYIDIDVEFTKIILILSQSLYQKENQFKLMSRINWGNGLEPPQIDDSFEKENEKEAYPQTVMDVLRISKKTLDRLSEKFLHPLENGNFSIEEVNKFIRDRFVQSPYTSDFSYTDKWWTAKEAHKETGIHRKQIQRLRNEDRNKNRVAHVKISSEIYLYYPPDVIQQSKR